MGTKAAVARAILGGRSASSVARKHNVGVAQAMRWRYMYEFGGLARLETVGREQASCDHHFVSYSRRDAEVVEPILRELTMNEMSLWVDRRDIVGGAEWRREIQRSIARARSFILMVSDASLASEEVAREIEHARDASRKIIPCIVRPLRKHRYRPGAEGEPRPLALTHHRDQQAGLLIDALGEGGEPGNNLWFRMVARRNAYEVSQSIQFLRNSSFAGGQLTCWAALRSESKCPRITIEVRPGAAFVAARISSAAGRTVWRRLGRGRLAVFRRLGWVRSSPGGGVVLEKKWSCTSPIECRAVGRSLVRVFLEGFHAYEGEPLSCEVAINQHDIDAGGFSYFRKNRRASFPADVLEWGKAVREGKPVPGDPEDLGRRTPSWRREFHDGGLAQLQGLPADEPEVRRYHHVCHVSGDREWVAALVNEIRANSVDVRTSSAGRTAWGDASHSIRGAASFLLMLSPGALGSARVRKELALAAEMGRKIVPVVIRPLPRRSKERRPRGQAPIELTPYFEQKLDGKQVIDLVGHERGGAGMIIEAIGEAGGMHLPPAQKLVFERNVRFISEALRLIQESVLQFGHVILGTGTDAAGGYVQYTFSLTEGWVYGEVMGNPNREADQQLTDWQVATLIRMGWREPEVTSSGKLRRYVSGNLHRSWSCRNDFERRAVAGAGLRALHEAFGHPWDRHVDPEIFGMT